MFSPSLALNRRFPLRIRENRASKRQTQAIINYYPICACGSSWPTCYLDCKRERERESKSESERGRRWRRRPTSGRCQLLCILSLPFCPFSLAPISMWQLRKMMMITSSGKKNRSWPRINLNDHFVHQFARIVSKNSAVLIVLWCCFMLVRMCARTKIHIYLRCAACCAHLMYASTSNQWLLSCAHQKGALSQGPKVWRKRNKFYNSI